jgi:hypothetical protein
MLLGLGGAGAHSCLSAIDASVRAAVDDGDSIAQVVRVPTIRKEVEPTPFRVLVSDGAPSSSVWAILMSSEPASRRP